MDGAGELSARPPLFSPRRSPAPRHYFLRGARRPISSPELVTFYCARRGDLVSLARSFFGIEMVEFFRDLTLTGSLSGSPDRRAPPAEAYKTCLIAEKYIYRKHLRGSSRHCGATGSLRGIYGGYATLSTLMNQFLRA